MNRDKRLKRAKRVKKAAAGKQRSKGKVLGGAHVQVNEKTFQLAYRYEQAGKLKTAEKYYRKILHVHPDDAAVHYNLGNVLSRQGRLEDATVSYKKAASINPGEASFYINLGNIYYLQGRTDDAEACYLQALDLRPEDVNIHINLSNIYKKQNKIERTIACLKRAIEINPQNPGMHLNIGYMLQKQQKFDEAMNAFQHALDTDPENHVAAHLLSALSGEKTETSPAQYVRDIFSRLSDDFEKHLVQNLKYSVPRLFRKTLEKIADKKLHFENVLDLGCGTGLCGVEFEDISDRMTGVDLSPEMIGKAKEKHIYDELLVSEMIEFLNSSGQQYDLAVASDVFIYAGNLQPVFRSVAKRLCKEAYFVFSTEKAEEDAYHLQKTGRYAHSSGYIQLLAKEHSFQIEWKESIKIRKEHGKWIMGDLFVLKLNQ